MKNLFISNLNEKDVNKFTSDFGLFIRRKVDKPFKKLCNIFTNANIIREKYDKSLSDDEYFLSLSCDKIPTSKYDLKKNKNNIVLERYPDLEKNESYIFVSNHTCPEDIETILNIIDRNTYLVLGSLETLRYNPEMYLLWINGMIPFDIMNSYERKNLMNKMERVIKNNSILIFPEGSHNYSPNNIINPLFDGPVNLSLKTNKKIVLISFLRDNDNNVSYIDVSNPIDLKEFKMNDNMCEKEYVHNITSIIRDKMATAVYYMMERHFDTLKRSEYNNIEDEIREKILDDVFLKMKWNKDIFDAEYLVKKTKEEKEYEDVIKTMANLQLKKKILLETKINLRDYIIKKNDLENKSVEDAMRRRLNKIKK